MSILATAYPAKPVRTKEAKRVAWVYAGLLIIMAVTQLTSFSAFILTLNSYWLPGGMRFAAVLAAFLILSELMACAFLLRFKLSPAFRIFAMGLGWLVPFFWFLLSLRAQLTSTGLTNVGFLGGSVTLVPGWWAVFVSLALAILAMWATWGLWPFPFQRPKRKK